MRRILLSALYLFSLCCPLFGQSDFKSEIFGGYQFTHFARFEQYNPVFPTVNAHGWNAAFTERLTRLLGVKADLGGAYGNDTSSNQNNSSVNMLTYTFGPVLSSKDDRGGPFAEVLLGGFHQAARTGYASTNGFALIAGGGFDAKIHGHWAFRAEADWILLTGSGSSAHSNVRVATGLVYRF